MLNKIIAAVLLLLGIISAAVIGNGTFAVLAGMIGAGLLISKENYIEGGVSK